MFILFVIYINFGNINNYVLETSFVKVSLYSPLTLSHVGRLFVCKVLQSRFAVILKTKYELKVLKYFLRLHPIQARTE
jgi:hypothetical protein